MLFPTLDDVPRYWYKVAEATADNRLGIGAKISTGLDDDRKERLICVYTKDFSDMDDIRRVLQTLVGLDSRGRPRTILQVRRLHLPRDQFRKRIRIGGQLILEQGNAEGTSF